MSSDIEYVPPPLVPEGQYLVAYEYHQTYLYAGKAAKVVFYFKILDMGDYFEKVIPRHYNVKRHKGKVGKNGDFVPTDRSDFLKDYCRVFPGELRRLDRIPLTKFKDIYIRASIRTVSKDYRQNEYPEDLYYSVIDKLIGKEE